MTTEDNIEESSPAKGSGCILAVYSTKTVYRTSEVIIKSEYVLRVPWLFH